MMGSMLYKTGTHMVAYNLYVDAKTRFCLNSVDTTYAMGENRLIVCINIHHCRPSKVLQFGILERSLAALWRSL